MKINKHIEIVRSSKPWLSSMSQVSCDAIFNVLSQHYSKVGVSTVDNLADLKELVAVNPDVAFLGVKFIPKNSALGLADPGKIWISEYLENNGIAYTGSSKGAVALELNKPLAKQRVLNAGLETPRFYIAKQNQSNIDRYMTLSFPIFIKPTSRGGGLGIDSGSIVYDYEQLQARAGVITNDLESDSLLEEYLPGREFSVAILKDEYSDNYSVMPIELIPPIDEFGLRFLTHKVKKDDTESSIYVTNGVLKSSVCELAINAFTALGAKDYGRIDIRLDNNNVPHFLEANLLPGLNSNPGNYFPKACRLNIDIDYESMLLRIVRLALDRGLDLEEDIEPALVVPVLAT